MSVKLSLHNIFKCTEANIKTGIGLLVFISTLIIYFTCLPSGVSLWDCPEYLLTAIRLEIGHPPGNPFWTLTHRVAVIIAGEENAAAVVNAMSAVFTALAVVLLYVCSLKVFEIISERKLIGEPDSIKRGSGRERLSPYDAAVSSLCAATGALMFAWCDSTLFSAVEAEVYAMSIFLTALTLWLMIRWYLLPPSPQSDRILLLISYLYGLSIGVHQLNLLVIPVLAVIYVYRRFNGKMLTRLVIAMLIGVGVIGIILIGMMPMTIRLASLCELIAVNTLNAPYFSGVIGFVVIFAIVGIAILISVTCKGSHKLYMIVWSGALVLTGYSSYTLILIRGAANPPVNESAPADIFALERYINREQYGSSPLFYGNTPYSAPMLQEEITPDSVKRYSRFALKKKDPVYIPYTENAIIVNRSGFMTREDSVANEKVNNKKNGYILADYRYQIIQTPELNMFFPRLTSGNPDDIEEYKAWAGMDTATMDLVAVSDAFDISGNPIARKDKSGTPVTAPKYRPTYLQHLTYFITYQLGYMYFRYLMWNFAGRQNDIPSTGESDHGNFITGYPLIDNLMLGDQSKLPPSAGKANPGHNVYYLLPFGLAIFGLIWLIRRGKCGRRIAFVSGLLFIMTGIAIVVYLNQTPGQPRERDYAFLGSYFAFAFWGGCGAYGLASLCRKREFKVAITLATLAVPIQMICQNYDDHCRHGRNVATSFATNILSSLPKNTILFVDGDNYTFPLWYAVEGLGVRPDVRVINISYLTLPSYVENLRIPTGYSPGVDMFAPPGVLSCGRFARVKVPQYPLLIEDSIGLPTLAHLLRGVYEDAAEGKSPAFRSRYVRVNENGKVMDLMNAVSVAGKDCALSLKGLSMLDIAAKAASEGRPVAWLTYLPERSYSGLFPFTYNGFYVRYLDSYTGTHYPDESPQQRLSGGADNPKVYFDPTSAGHISLERITSLLHAERLMDAGKPREALAEVRLALSLFPLKNVALHKGGADGKMVYEAERFGSLLIRAGNAAEDTEAVAMGRQILQTRLNEQKQWREYINSLPMRLRPAVSYSNRVGVARIDTVRNLLNYIH